MKKFLSAITASLMLCITSCSQPEPAAPDVSTLDALSKEFGLGIMDQQDLDGDGDADRGTFTITEDRTDEGLKVTQVVEVWETTDGATGAITVQLEPLPGGALTDDFVLEIPKAFAENVDQLRFSPEPDAILEADPKVSYAHRMMKEAEKDLQILTISLLDAFMVGPETGSAFVVNKMDGIAFNMAVIKCDRITDSEERELCALSAVERWQHNINPGSCQDRRFFSLDGLPTRICRALVSGDFKECTGTPARPFESELCKAYLAESQCSRTTQPFEACMFEKAVAYRTTLGCYRLKDPEQTLRCVCSIDANSDACAKERQLAKKRASAVYAIESWFPREIKTWERLTQRFSEIVPDAEGYGDGCDPWGRINIECRWNQPTGIAGPYGNDIEWYTALKVTLYGSDATAKERLEAMPAEISKPEYASSAKRQIMDDRVIDTIIIPTPGGGPTQKQIRQYILYGNTSIYIEGLGPVGGEKGSEAIERTIKSIIDAKRAGGEKAASSGN